MSSLRKSVPIWVRALQGLGILLFFFAALLVYGAIQVSRKVPESYAAWTSGNILVGYLKTHTNQWPRSWDEIRKESETIGVSGGLIYTPIERLPEFVKIDWSVDVKELTRLSLAGTNANFRVVTRLDGSKLKAMWGSDTEPNNKIASYLRTTVQPPKPGGDMN